MSNSNSFADRVAVVDFELVDVQWRRIGDIFAERGGCRHVHLSPLGHPASFIWSVHTGLLSPDPSFLPFPDPFFSFSFVWPLAGVWPLPGYLPIAGLAA